MAKEDRYEPIKLAENKVFVRLERTVQIVNYEPIKLAVGEERIIGEDDDPAEIRQNITQQLTREINSFVKACQ